MLNPGTTLSGRYEIESVLGRGGMGAVYLARVPNLGNKPVAVKEMRLQAGDQAPTQSAVDQFKKEATFLANLEHPNLVQVTDFFEENSCHYLVMQYVEGSTLDAVLRETGSPVSTETALDWAEQLCSVLHYLHTRTPPILFRDLKPSNVMLDREKRIRLIDFGIARVLDPVKGTSTFLQGVGSPGYAPLEQYEGQGSTDARSDIYSLGATMFHLLANAPPPSPIGLVSQQMTLPNLCELNPEVPPALNDLVHHMMGLRQEQRPETVAFVRDRLKEIRSGKSAPVSPPAAADRPTAGLEPVTSNPGRGFPKALAAAAVVAVLGLPFLAKALTGSPQPDPTASPVAVSRSHSPDSPGSQVSTEEMPVEEMPPVSVQTRQPTKPAVVPTRPTQPESKPLPPPPPPEPVEARVVPDQGYPSAEPAPVAAESAPDYPQAAPPQPAPPSRPQRFQRPQRHLPQTRPAQRPNRRQVLREVRDKRRRRTRSAAGNPLTN